MIRVENIKKTFNPHSSARNQVLKGVSFELPDKGLVAIFGKSGSGKTTLLNIIGGLEKADSGEVCLDGKDICSMSESERTKFRRDNVGFIFQQYYLLPNMNVDKNVRMGADLASNSDYRKIISAVGLDGKVKKYPGELSGGEQQRVAIARALAKKPTVLFLDEPTGALDEKTGRQVLDVITKLQSEQGFTMIMVTHNINIAEMANTVIKVSDGKIAEVYKNDVRKSAFEIGW